VCHVVLQAFDVLERLDPTQQIYEAKRGAAVGAFQMVVAGKQEVGLGGQHDQPNGVTQPTAMLFCRVRSSRLCHHRAHMLCCVLCRGSAQMQCHQSISLYRLS
jgi:hypothetical protein